MALNLNKEQQEVVKHVDGPCMVVACPGSGKSHTLIERTARLISMGYDSKKIVCITFTNKAAKEMRDRIEARLGRDNSCFIGTFHALCLSVLRKFYRKAGYESNFTIINQNDQKDLISQVARQNGLDLEKNQIDYLSNVSNNWRENLEDDNELLERCNDREDFVTIIKDYFDRLKKDNCIDFSGMLYETVCLLKDNIDIASKIQEKCQFIQVDEIQDTNYIQFYLIELLAKTYSNIVCVGDISQSVYSFRGSRYQNILDFLKKHKNCKQITLHKNYRSTPQIIEKSHNLIKHNKSHMGNTFVTDNPDGENVVCINLENQIEEANWVANHINKLIHQGGWDASDISILYRINSLSRPLESALTTYGIKYRVVGGRSFYDRMEVKDCLAMLRFVFNDKDGISFHRMMGIVKGIGNVTIGKIENISKDKNFTIVEAIREFMTNNTKSKKIQKVSQKILDVFDKDLDFKNPAVLLDNLVNDIGYYDHLKVKAKTTEEYETRKGNVQELINSAAIMHENNGTDLQSFLHSISLVTTGDDIDDDSGEVILSTIHASKGLEYPIVFIVGIEQNIIPHSLAIQDSGEEGLEEERRILYVGMTRAKKLLYMSYCNKRKVFQKDGFKLLRCKPSQFLYEADL